MTSTKQCPKCGNTNLLRFTTFNYKICTDCNTKIPWYREKEEPALYPIHTRQEHKMPIPKPKTNEKQDTFTQRCMGDTVMNKDFPDRRQRYAVCMNSWKQSKKKKK